MRRPLATPLLALLAACTAAPQGTSEPEGEESVAPISFSAVAPLQSGDVAQQLVASGALTEAEAARLLRLGAESGWALFRTPAVPGATDRVVFVAACEGCRPFQKAEARSTFDGGKTWSDVPGTAFGKPGEGWAFDLGRHPAGTEVQAALHLFDDYELWINRGEKNLRASVLAPAPLQWLGAVELSQDGLRRATSEALYTSHDLTVAVETYPASPDARVSVHYRVGGGQAQRVDARLVAVDAGQYGNNQRWTAVLPTASLAEGASLVWWVEAATSLNTLWESNGGANYSARVSLAPPQATWGAAGHYWWRRYDSGYGAMPEPFPCTPSEFGYGMGPLPAFELYIPGITDRADSEAVAAGGFARVEVYTPFFSGSPDGAWQGRPLLFREKVGNNWRFRWNVRRWHEGYAGMSSYDPVGVERAANGDYPFKFRVSTDAGKSWQWVGLDGFPGGGANRTLHWENNVRQIQLTVWGETTFPETKVGKKATQRVELINTMNEVMKVSEMAFWGEPKAFTVKVDGCSGLSTCTKVLAPGERFGVSFTFAPKDAYPEVSATFNVRLDSHPNAGEAFGGTSVVVTGSSVR